jgi:holo-[acyl-carrier protein] synthase
VSRGLSGSSVAVGVDVVDVVEFQHNAKVGGDRWMARLFTTGEINHCDGRCEQLATRFAAKEAVVKVLGTGFRGVQARDVEVLTAPEGQPTVILHGDAATAAMRVGIDAVLVSMSREGPCAAAIAIGVRVGATEQGDV